MKYGLLRYMGYRACKEPFAWQCSPRQQAVLDLMSCMQLRPAASGRVKKGFV